MTLNIPCHSLLACRGYPEKSADNFMQVPMFVTCYFSFAPFNSVFLSLFFCHFNYNESWCGPLWVDPVLALLCLLDLVVCFLSQVRDVFSSYVFRYVLHWFLFPFCFWDQYNANISTLDVVSQVCSTFIISFYSIVLLFIFNDCQYSVLQFSDSFLCIT